jgi:hypothetical protein
MRFRDRLSLLTLAVGLIFAPPIWAQQKPVAPTFRACPECNEGSAHRSGGFTPPWRGKLAATGADSPARDAMMLAMPAEAQQNPKAFTRDQVQAMVRDGLGDETGAKAIEQRGIDFAPTEEFIQNLKAAGANEAFLAALRAAKHPEPANAKKPVNQIQVFAVLAGQVPSHRVATLVQERGIDFEPDDEYLREVRLAGGEDELATFETQYQKEVSYD